MQPCNLPSCLKIGVDPVALHMGPLALYWYGLLVAVGFVVAIRLAGREAEKQALDPDQLLSAALVGALFGLLVSRVFFVLQNSPRAYLDPKQIGAALSLWQGGLSFYGGLVGGAIGIWLYSSRNDMPTLRLLDIAGLVAPLGLAIGRLGNAINGDLTGIATRGWGVQYTNPANPLLPVGSLGRTQHPVALYDVVLELGLFALLYLAWRRRPLRVGQLAGLYLAGWATIQLFLQAFRDTPVTAAGLKSSQLIALPVIAAGLVLYLRSAGGPFVRRYRGGNPGPEGAPVPAPAPQPVGSASAAVTPPGET
ncbi:MAG: prolipoprotein diacylglyceryl transferase [Candidatus Dormibacteria bacterium]